MMPDQQQGEAERSVDVLRTMQRSHNTALLTAEEHPRSAVLADHSADTKLAMDAVAEYIAANDEYDEALIDLNSASDEVSRNVTRDGLRRVWDAKERHDTATERRALAHARMKGETK